VLRRPPLLLAFLLGSLPGRVCPAQTPTQVARAHFDSGQRLYDVGEFARALEEFKASYLASDDPVLLFNMAQCQRQLGQGVEASRLYRNYLRRRPDAPNRAEVERRIEELRATTPGDSAPAAHAPPAPPPLAPAPPPAVIDARREQPAAEATPVYGRWWFWAAAVGVVALGTAAALTLGRGPERPSCLAPYDCK
jgi:hypothetical protein